MLAPASIGGRFLSRPALRRQSGRSPQGTARKVKSTRCGRFLSTAADDRLNAPRDSDQADVVIVGGGPSGLSAAIRIKQMCKASGKDLRVCLLEKSAEVGAPRDLNLSSSVFLPTFAVVACAFVPFRFIPTTEFSFSFLRIFFLPGAISIGPCNLQICLFLAWAVWKTHFAPVFCPLYCLPNTYFCFVASSLRPFLKVAFLRQPHFVGLCSGTSRSQRTFAQLEGTWRSYRN